MTRFRPAVQVSGWSWPSLKLALLVLIGGLAHAASIAWPFAGSAAMGVVQGQPLWWLQLGAMCALCAALMRATRVRQGAWLGWVFATSMQCGTWWWLFISLHTYGGLASPLAVVAIVGLAAFLALYYAVVCGLYIRLAQYLIAGRAIIFASLWLMGELARVQFFTGFPWGEGGYAQLDGPFDALAKVIGVHGLTWGSALLAAVLVGGFFPALSRGHLRSLAWTAGGVVVAVVMSSALRIGADGASRFTAPQPANPPFTVTLLQGNIAQDEKFMGSSGIPDALNWYGRQLLAANTALVVTPETALPLLPEQLPAGYVDTLTERFTAPPPAGTAATAALIGIPLGSSVDGYTNSVIGLKPQPNADAQAKPVVYRYDKHHLVPFGEFVHPLFKWFLALVNMPLSDFNTGAVSQPSLEWQGQRIAPNICYEDLFGEELAVRFVDPALAPTMLVNISNIAWFGDSVAIDQHLNISRLRAIELERPMLRATNTGATAVIDHRGQVTHRLPRLTRGSLQAKVEGRTGTTPYAWWAGRFGLWPWWGLCLTVVVVATIRARRA